jgi:hypothetical protein
MLEFNEWMTDNYGYSWDEHEKKLKDEGFEREDVLDELLGLLYVWSKLTVGTVKEG